jgi:hypothetical protein
MDIDVNNIFDFKFCENAVIYNQYKIQKHQEKYEHSYKIFERNLIKTINDILLTGYEYYLIYLNIQIDSKNFLNSINTNDKKIKVINMGRVNLLDNAKFFRVYNIKINILSDDNYKELSNYNKYDIILQKQYKQEQYKQEYYNVEIKYHKNYSQNNFFICHWMLLFIENPYEYDLCQMQKTGTCWINAYLNLIILSPVLLNIFYKYSIEYKKEYNGDDNFFNYKKIDSENYKSIDINILDKHIFYSIIYNTKKNIIPRQYYGNYIAILGALIKSKSSYHIARFRKTLKILGITMNEKEPIYNNCDKKGDIIKQIIEIYNNEQRKDDSIYNAISDIAKICKMGSIINLLQSGENDYMAEYGSGNTRHNYDIIEFFELLDIFNIQRIYSNEISITGKNPELIIISNKDKKILFLIVINEHNNTEKYLLKSMVYIFDGKKKSLAEIINNIDPEYFTRTNTKKKKKNEHDKLFFIPDGCILENVGHTITGKLYDENTKIIYDSNNYELTSYDWLEFNYEDGENKDPKKNVFHLNACFFYNEKINTII